MNKAVILVAAVVGTFSQCFNGTRNLNGFYSDILGSTVDFETDEAQALNSAGGITTNATWPISEDIQNVGPTVNSVNWNSSTEHQLMIMSAACPDGATVEVFSSACAQNDECSETCTHEISQANIKACVDDVAGDNTHEFQLCPFQKVSETGETAAYNHGNCHKVTIIMDTEGSATTNNRISVTQTTVLAFTGANFISLGNGSCTQSYSADVWADSDFPAASFASISDNWTISEVPDETPLNNGESKFGFTFARDVECCSCECGEGYADTCAYDADTVEITDGESTLVFSAGAKTITVSGDTFTVTPDICMSTKTDGTNCELDGESYQYGDTGTFFVLIDPLVHPSAFTVTTSLDKVEHWGKSPADSCEDTEGLAADYAYVNHTAVGFGHTFQGTMGVENGVENYVNMCTKAIVGYVIINTKRRARRRVLLTELIGSQGQITGTTTNSIVRSEDKANLAFKHSCSMSLLMIAVAAIIF